MGNCYKGPEIKSPCLGQALQKNGAALALDLAGVGAGFLPGGDLVVVFGLGLGGGSGVSANAVNVPYPQNPNSIANGLSYSLTYQPSSALGSTVQYSPGSGPPVRPTASY
jgi:hypothetical protein